MEIVLLVVVGYLILAMLNGWREQATRLRCGARVGLLGRCPVFVSPSVQRCPKHTGLGKRRWP